MATFLVLLLPLLAIADGAVEYYGKALGPLSSYHHGISGTVYAVDARTLHIRDFTYDGEGPAAYFYAGSTKSPSSNGFIVRDEKGLSTPLKRYRNKHVTITLPEGKTLHNIKWLSIWCEEFAVNFGDVKIPKNLDVPKPQKLASLAGVHGVSSEPVVIVDAQTLLIPSFSYDGEAPDAKFWVGRGSKPSPQGVRIPDENGKETPLRRYDHKTIVLTLPGDLTVFDIGHFGVWCEAFTVDFGHIQIGGNLNVPPSLKMLGVSPQKRSRSLQSSALQQSVQVNSEQEKGGFFQRDYQQQQRLVPQQHQQQQFLLYQQQEYQQPQQYQQFLQLQQQYQPFQQQQDLQQQQFLQQNQNDFSNEKLQSYLNAQQSIRPTTYKPQFLLPSSQQHRFSKKKTEGYLPLTGSSVPQQHPDDDAVQIVPSISLSPDEQPRLPPPLRQNEKLQERPQLPTLQQFQELPFQQPQTQLQQQQSQQLVQQITPSDEQRTSTYEFDPQSSYEEGPDLTAPQRNSNDFYNVAFKTTQPPIQHHIVQHQLPNPGGSFSRFIINTGSGSSDSFVQY